MLGPCQGGLFVFALGRVSWLQDLGPSLRRLKRSRRKKKRKENEEEKEEEEEKEQ